MAVSPPVSWTPAQYEQALADCDRSSSPDRTNVGGVASAFALNIFPWALLPLGTGLALASALLVLSYNQAWVDAGNKWVFFLDWPIFGDLAITLRHFHQTDAGLDPLSDPDSGFAYPRAVLVLRHLGLQHLSTRWIGFVQACAVVTAIVVLLRPATARRALATTVLFISPSLVLGFEKANIDFALFLLCYLCALLWSRASTVKALIWPAAGLMLGAILKLHPIFALLGAGLADNGRGRLVWLTGTALVVAFWALHHDEMALIAEKIPVPASWGCLTTFTVVERMLSSDRSSFVGRFNVHWPLVAVLTYAAAAGVACCVGVRIAAGFRSVRWERWEWCAYLIGASICCGSFAGANYGQRWIFAVLTLPFLFRVSQATSLRAASWSRLTLVFVFASLLAPLVGGKAVTLLTQLSHWACIFLLIVGCVCLRVVANTPPTPTSSRGTAREPEQGTREALAGERAKLN